MDTEYEPEFADLIKGISESVDRDILMEAANVINKGESTGMYNTHFREHSNDVHF